MDTSNVLNATTKIESLQVTEDPVVETTTNNEENEQPEQPTDDTMLRGITKRFTTSNGKKSSTGSFNEEIDDPTLNKRLSMNKSDSIITPEMAKRYPYNMLKEDLYQDELQLDPRDAKTPDNWILRHPEMTRLTGIHPFNCESPVDKIMEAGFLTPSAIHYTRNHGACPKIEWEDHRLEISSDEPEVNPTITLTMNDIAAMPTTSVVITMCCAGNRRKEENLTKRTVGFSWNTTAHSTALWTGVRLRDVLLHKFGLKWPGEPGWTQEDQDKFDDFAVEDRYVWMTGADELPKGNYGTCLPLGHVMDIANDVILAYRCNGKIMAPDRGYPLRVVIPGWIGGRMVKWLTRLEIRRTESNNHYHYFDNRILPPNVTKEIADEEGWWMKPEYLFNELNINSALTTPAHGTEIPLVRGVDGTDFEMDNDNEFPLAMIDLKGYAYTGGGRRVTRVEISFDHGLTWNLADIERFEKPTRYNKSWCWVHWSFQVDEYKLIGPNRFIHVRAWDDSNNTQPDHLTWNVMGMGNNCFFGVKVEVSDGKLTFIHPTREAGMSEVGWMKTSNNMGKNGKLMAPRAVQRHFLADDTDDDTTDMDGSEADSEVGAMWALERELLDSSPIYPMSEIELHNTEESAWIVVDGLVYDCTKFLEEHPGGASSIVMNAGTDCTADFIDIHSKKAQRMLKDYFIGRLDRKEPSDSNMVGKETIEEDVAILQKHKWVNFYLVHKVVKTHNTIVLRFSPKPLSCYEDGQLMTDTRRIADDSVPLGLPVGKHVMIKTMAPGGADTENPDELSQVVRAYTPLIDVHEENDEFTLVVKVYRANEHPRFPLGGRMSQALDKLSVGDSLAVRGPCGHILYRGNGRFRVSGRDFTVKNAAFICGGTGITPAYRIITAAFSDPNDGCRFYLLYANNTPDDILLRKEIDQLAKKYPARLKVWYTVTEVPEGEEWKFSTGFVDEEMVRTKIPSGKNGDTFVGLCGPPPMIKFACVPNLEKVGYSSDMYATF